MVWGVLDTSSTMWASAAPQFGLLGPGLSSFTTITLSAVGLVSDTTYTSRLFVVSNDALHPTITFPLSLRVEPLTAVGPDGPGVPGHYALRQNYPNPFNPETNISFDLPRASWVRVGLYNILGQEVALPVNAYLPAGTHAYRISAEKLKLGSGVYFYRMDAGEFHQTRKMMLLH
jgi:hypothetical protein